MSRIRPAGRLQNQNPPFRAHYLLEMKALLACKMSPVLVHWPHVEAMNIKFKDWDNKTKGAGIQSEYDLSIEHNA